MKKIYLAALVFVLLIPVGSTFARGGGGGSGGGGSFGGSFGGNSSSGNSNPAIVAAVLVVLMGSGIVLAVAARKKRKQEQVRAATPEGAAALARTKEVFFIFETAWAQFDIDGMKPILSSEYFKRMVLELSVLKAQDRQDKMENMSARFALETDVSDTAFRVRVNATAVDTLWDIAIQKTLFVDRSPFTEYWRFIKEENVWKLDGIDQATASAAMIEPDIFNFASRNRFYYDPDFGWLMLPNKGAIFSESSFGKSDINNHVIGWYRDKIVEFYTYIPVAGKNPNWLVAQAILPRSYRDVLIRPKRFLDFAPRGLARITLEGAEFNEKFEVYAAPGDEISSLELLAPNFMEKIQALPFLLNIEIVGPFLYFYTKDRGADALNDMLQVLSWAFDEMKL